MYSSSPQHATAARALAHRAGDSTSSASVSSSSSSSNKTPPPYLTQRPQTHTTRGSERGPKPSLNHSRSSSASPVYQDSRYPMFRQSSPQYFDVSPTSPPRETLAFHGRRPGGPSSSTPPPTKHRVPVPAYTERPATRMDRRRESLMKNASLRVHPFIAMGDSQNRSAQIQEVLEESGRASEPVGYRWAAGPSGNNGGASQVNAAPPAAQTTAAVASSAGHSRSISFAQSNQAPSPATSRPPATRAHQRTVSENPTSAAPMAAAPQRRGLGLVRKISFRSRADRATPTPTPARFAPVRASSDDSELLIKPSEENDDSRTPRTSRASPVPMSAVQATASPARLPTSTSAGAALSRSASTTQVNTPVRPTRSPRRSPAQATVEPSVIPAAQAGASQQQPSTPPPPPPRPLIPRSPTVGAARRTSGSGSPRRQSLNAARRAEREWKAKLAALAAAAPSTAGAQRPSNGPRPPPRRVPLPSSASVGIEGRMAQSVSLSHLASTVDTPEKQRGSYATTDKPDLTAAPSGAKLPRSASTSNIPRPRRSPAATAALLPGVPEFEPTTLSPIEQEPVSPLTSVACAEPKLSRRASPPPALSRKSLAPSQRTFGGHAPSPSFGSRDWMPDERVVVTRSSVPDLGRVASPPPVPTTPASPGLRLAERTPPAPAPACTPSPPRTFEHLPPPPTPPQILAARGSPGDKLQAAMLDAQPNRLAHRMHVRSKSKPNMRDEAFVSHSPPPLPTAPLPPTPLKYSRPAVPARATAAAPSILPRTTSLQARDIVADTGSVASTPRQAVPAGTPVSRSLAPRPKTNIDVTVVENPLASEDAPKSSAASHKLREVYDLTPGLDTGRRPRKRGLPMDDLQRWLAQTAVV